jgi:hypothetical protein
MKNTWVRGAGVVVAALGIAAGGVACGSPAKTKTQADVDRAREAGIQEGRFIAAQELAAASRAAAKRTDNEGKPYRLNRETWRVTVTPRPVVRTRCWISTETSGAPQDRDERVVEWDPSTSDSPDRFVTLRRGPDATLRCAAESSDVGSGDTPDTITYDFDSGAPSDSGVATAGGTLVHLTATDKTRAALRVDVAAKRWSDAGAVPYSSWVNPPVSQGGQRSLDPLTPLFTELATVIAEVAVERAKSGVNELAKERLRSFVCKIGYGVSSSRGASAVIGGVKLCKSAADCDVVFKKTCASIDFLRVEELAASADALGRALAGDLTEYAFRALRVRVGKGETDQIVGLTLDSLNRSLQALIDGNAIRTERDFQALLIGLSQVPVGPSVAPARKKERSEAEKALRSALADAGVAPAADASAEKLQEQARVESIRRRVKPDGDAGTIDELFSLEERLRAAVDSLKRTPEANAWRCGVGIGGAVLRECLERDVCSVSALQTSLEKELKDPSNECPVGVTQKIRREWPELPTILARAVDVMRPPPGTSASQTAKAATVIVLEVMEKLATWGAKERETDEAVRKADEEVRTAFDATKALTTALFDRDYAGAAVASTRLISSAIAKCGEDNSSWDEKKYCDTGLDYARLKKSVALLNGFVSYAASYRKEPSGASDGKSDAEREKARRDERKKAMNDLVDAMTDRSGRGREHIVSFGVGVGFASSRAARGESLEFAPNLTLPTGVAWDWTPDPRVGKSPWKYLGSHVQLSLLDVAQFMAVTKDGEVQDKPGFGTAFLFGTQLGALIGSPKYSFLLGADLGYAPGMKLPNVDNTGVWRVGGFVGTYIPFIDFN